MNIIKIISCALILLLQSCSSLGPYKTQVERLSYNYSLHNSENQQLLLNIVRLRYFDNIYFLSLNNIVAQMSLATSLRANIAKIEKGPLSGFAEGDVGYQERPTITYTPLQGEDFVKRLLIPIDLKVVYALLRSGWGINHVFRMVIQRINHINNAVSASRIVGSHIPHFKKFKSLSWVFYYFEERGNLDITYGKIHGYFAIKLTFHGIDKIPASGKKLLRELHITPQTPYIWLVAKQDNQPHHAYIETRSILGFLNYMSKGIVVPEELIKHNQVPMTRYPNGKIFDWNQVTQGMITIRASREHPRNTYVKVYYNGYWYYIPNNDFHSKETFILLNIFYGFQQGKITNDVPVFTVS
ncbi:hypothetical protein [Legionella spiritensis]|uniref:Lipoprotein n=1 Tax=Legionella spiritensis TaxID=452 RepID=A0A0W0YZU6_LEGSP|nr:hypothetical protein [Legionella spiritensis]KTD62099.1 hypothetical protein Lspi_1949 [Legionella spiritensis]SNV35643.1 Uncharacterised protein [Legionella spiritensis]